MENNLPRNYIQGDKICPRSAQIGIVGNIQICPDTGKLIINEVPTIITPNKATPKEI